MDCFGLAGEKPTMPAPPNVCPLWPVLLLELPPDPVAPVPPAPEVPDVSLGAPVDGAVPLVSDEEPTLEPADPKPELEEPKLEEPNPP